MRYLKITIFILFFSAFINHSFSEELYFIDMKKVLNNSKAGSNAQEILKKDFANQDKKFKSESSSLKKEETELINQKKTLSADEYKKKVSELRKRNIDFQTRRRNASNEFTKKRNKARATLLKAINPILEKYMADNNIMMVVNEKNVILANTKRDLTKTIIDLLDKELKSIKVN